MTANEMADLLIQFDSGRVYEHSQEIAEMLRTLQAELKMLKSPNRTLGCSFDLAEIK